MCIPVCFVPMNKNPLICGYGYGYVVVVFLKFLPVVSHYSSDKLVAVTQQEAETSGKSLEGSAYTKFVRP